MIGNLDRDTRRRLRTAAIAGLFVLAVFVAGASRTERRAAGLVALREEAEGRAAVRDRQALLWEPVTGAEEDLWRGAAERYEQVVPAGDVRLAVPRDLAALATRCGLARVNLAEIGEREVLTAYQDAFEEVVDGRTGARVAEADMAEETPAPWSADEGVRTEAFHFRLRFSADYDALLDFLRGLEAAPGLIVLRQVVVKRGSPDLEVELILTAHRRVV